MQNKVTSYIIVGYTNNSYFCVLIFREMTNGELVSRVVNSLRMLNKDEHISRRYILRTARSKARFYISQKAVEQSMLRISELYKTIQCVELEPVDVIKCCDIVEFKSCKKLMKSKKKLPELIYNRHGFPVLTITDLSSNVDFTFISPKVYRNQKDRKFSGILPSYNYYLQDNYIYIPDHDIRLVSIELMTMEDEKIDELSACSDKKDEDKDCKSVWDYEFVCPKHLLEVVVQETLKEIGSMVRAIQIDENPNLDSNIKSQTTQ